MKKTLSTIMAVILLFCMASALGVSADSAELPSLNVDVDTGDMTVIPVAWSLSKGITPWAGEEVDKLFDGLYGVPSDDAMGSYFRTDEEKGTKLGGQVIDLYVTVDFATTEASAIRYYTFYTGFDTALETDRNPIAWTLYGLDENLDMHVLHEVESDETVSTGMEPINCAPYTYEVPAENVGVYTDYLFEFTVSGEYFQLNEIVLFGDVGVEESPADTPSQENPSETTAATTTAPTSDDAGDGTGAPIVPIVIAVVSVIAVAAVVVVVIVVLKKKKS